MPRGSADRAAAPVCVLAAGELGRLAVDHLAHLLVGDVQAGHHVVVHHHAAAAGQRAHRELRPARHPELADQEHVQRRAQRRGDFPGHRHAAAGQPEAPAHVPVAVGRSSSASARPASRRSRNVRVAVRRRKPLGGFIGCNPAYGPSSSLRAVAISTDHAVVRAVALCANIIETPSGLARRVILRMATMW